MSESNYQTICQLLLGCLVLLLFESGVVWFQKISTPTPQKELEIPEVCVCVCVGGGGGGGGFNGPGNSRGEEG